MGTTVTSSLEIITPSIASQLLLNNKTNRHVAKSLISYYANQIEDDKWSVNGEPIIIGSTGALMNGQHRCLAVIKANKSIVSMIVRGVDESTFDTIDTGKNRTAADVLGIAGFNELDSRILSTTTRLILQFDEVTGRINMNSNQKPSNHVVLETVENNPLIKKAVKWVLSFPHKNRIVPAGWMGFLTIRCGIMDSDRSEEYLQQVFTGLELEQTDIAYLVRQRIDRSNRAQVKMTPKQKSQIIARGWFYYLRGTWPEHEQNMWKNISSGFLVFANKSVGGVDVREL